MQVSFDHSETVAENIVSFYFRPDQPLKYVAGQFIELTLPHEAADERGTRHWFTLSSSPTEELLAITTKLPSGRMSTFKQTLQQLQPGQAVLMSEPMGDFVLPKNPDTPLAFIAGGIGITPLRSMAKWLQDTGERRPMDLLHAGHTGAELPFGALFRSIGLQPFYFLDKPPAGWTGQEGRLNAARILKYSPDAKHKLYYVSGPEPMVESLVKDLRQHIDDHRVVGDYFPNYSAV